MPDHFMPTHLCELDIVGCTLVLCMKINGFREVIKAHPRSIKLVENYNSGLTKENKNIVSPRIDFISSPPRAINFFISTSTTTAKWGRTTCTSGTQRSALCALSSLSLRPAPGLLSSRSQSRASRFFLPVYHIDRKGRQITRDSMLSLPPPETPLPHSVLPQAASTDPHLYSYMLASGIFIFGVEWANRVSASPRIGGAEVLKGLWPPLRYHGVCFGESSAMVAMCYRRRCSQWHRRKHTTTPPWPHFNHKQPNSLSWKMTLLFLFVPEETRSSNCIY